MELQLIKRLVGAELAQDDANFTKYAVKDENLLNLLRNPDHRFTIINATRGSGKSGLLICHERDVIEKFPRQHLVIKKFQSDVRIPADVADFQSALEFWKNTIRGWIVSEIGIKLEVPVDPDLVAAVNYAEEIGRREITLAAGRLRKREPGLGEGLSALTDDFVCRLLEKTGTTVWLLFDEMDDYYDSSARFKERLIGLLKASKHFAKTHRNIRMRITIRPHILTTLARTSDVGQTFRGDVVNLSWNETQLMRLLARRIEIFDGVNGLQLSIFDKTDPHKAELETLKKTIGRYFDSFDAALIAGRGTDYRALATFSLYRPRWMIELCHLALESAQGDKATVKDFKKAMAAYGRNRVVFLAGEHERHFPDFEAVVNQIAAGREWRFGSSSLLKEMLIRTIVRSGLRPPAPGGAEDLHRREENAALVVAQELYMVEFLRARQHAGGKRNHHRFYTYTERPSLLSSWADGAQISWEIHPTFTRSLNMIESETFAVGDEYRLFSDKKTRKPFK